MRQLEFVRCRGMVKTASVIVGRWCRLPGWKVAGVGCLGGGCIPLGPHLCNLVVLLPKKDSHTADICIFVIITQQTKFQKRNDNQTHIKSQFTGTLLQWGMAVLVIFYRKIHENIASTILSTCPFSRVSDPHFFLRIRIRAKIFMRIRILGVSGGGGWG